MNTIVARIRRVLNGHSPTALIHAADAQGHEQRFEVPVELTRDAVPGRVIVIQWSIHDIPDALQDARGIEVEALPAEQVGDGDTRITAPPAAPAPATGNDEISQLEGLLGLRPGRLRGT
jgi:hypothetical protein